MTQTLVLPCSRCGSAHAVELTPPLIGREARKFVDPVLKIISLRTGERIELPKDGASWLDLFGNAANLAEVLQLRCSHCLAIEADLPARAFDAEN